MGSIHIANLYFESTVTMEFSGPSQPIATIRQCSSIAPTFKEDFCGFKRELARWRPNQSTRISRRR
jgi:hypothetical protein